MPDAVVFFFSPSEPARSEPAIKTPIDIHVMTKNNVPV